ncbi:hypothetical protein D3C81_2218280 [compost metagenome]
MQGAEFIFIVAHHRGDADSAFGLQHLVQFDQLLAAQWRLLIIDYIQLQAVLCSKRFSQCQGFA